jgi:hypothetical protein
MVIMYHLELMPIFFYNIYVFYKNLRQNIMAKYDVVCCECDNVPASGFYGVQYVMCFRVEISCFMQSMWSLQRFIRSIGNIINEIDFGDHRLLSFDSPIKTHVQSYVYRLFLPKNVFASIFFPLNRNPRPTWFVLRLVKPNDPQNNH